MPRGGARPRSGRPKGQGKFGVVTKAMRVPENMIEEVTTIIKNKLAKLPLYTMRVDAGSPFLVDSDDYELVSVQDNLFEYNPNDYFLVKVSGYSMQDAGILPDDLLIAKRSREAKDGDIIIANVGGGVVVKRLSKLDAGVTLISENIEYSDIEINEASNFTVQGVVVKVMRDV